MRILIFQAPMQLAFLIAKRLHNEIITKESFTINYN